MGKKGGPKDQERIEALRKRLYKRGNVFKRKTRHELTDTPEDVPTSWRTTVEEPEKTPKDRILPESLRSKQPSQKGGRVDMHVMSKVTTPEESQAPRAQTDTPVLSEQESEYMSPRKRRRSYRLKLVIASLVFFVVAVGISSLFLVLGTNTISGENITISVTGPFTIGGGDVLSLQIGITNGNTVSIESATLIVEYPLGTQSSTEIGRELFVDRLPLETINANETINIPIRAVVFGEENDEKIVKISIEYRVKGSNALFFKEAEPLRFKITSSPLVLDVVAVRKVSSGQEIDIEIIVRSNSPTTITDILVKAEYPQGFDYTLSEPEPISGENTWMIKELEPEGSATITIRGIIIGKESDEYAMLFTAGRANERNPSSIVSVFSTATTEFEIEHPFIDVRLEIEGQEGDAVLDEIDNVQVEITITNSLEDTIYDARAEVKLSGNALSDFKIDVRSGFYDSTTNIIFWDATTVEGLREMAPGASLDLTFTLTPSSDINRTPQINIDVDVRARRVSESRVSEELIGTAEGVLKVASDVVIRSETSYGVGSLVGTGPIPPVAEVETSYVLSLMAQNGTNDLASTEITATLPLYVTWLDTTSGSGDISFNQTTRLVTWRIGNVGANDSETVSFKVSFVPSITQIGTTPTLLGDQRLKATDRFTGTIIRTMSSAITTELSTEAGYPKGNGRVIAEE